MGKNYNPIFYQGSKNFLAVKNNVLKNLINKEIKNYYLLYDIEDNSWWQTQPIILVIDGNQYEFLFDNLSDFSLTINQINTKEKCNWYEQDEIDVAWKSNCNQDIDNILNKKIKEINIIEIVLLTKAVKNQKDKLIETVDNSYFSLAGIELKFEENQKLTIYNSLNENSITSEDIENIFNKVKKIKVK